jgi:hypothetical protein
MLGGKRCGIELRRSTMSQESKVSNAVYTQPGRDQFNILRCISLASAALAEGTNDHTIKTVTNPVAYMIDGKFCSKSATDNIAVTTCTVQAISKRCRYLISIDADGNVAVTKGTEVRALSTGALTTLSWDATEKKLKDSAGVAFASFRVGDMINVSGFSEEENNGIFHIDDVETNGAWVKVRENVAVSEIEGDSVTVLVESALPDLPYKQAPLGYMIITTGTTAFTVGTQDITDDIGTGSVSFVNCGVMPTDALS